MSAKLLGYYNRELQHLREMGAEFAAAFPKIAGRLGLESFECADPYVERLLEGFSFLAARVQMKLDAEFPSFTGHLAEMVYPQFMAPTPSMAVVQFEPDWSHSSLSKGYTVPRHTVLHSQLDRHSPTRCEYRTAHAVPLLPLRIAQADYLPYTGAIAGLSLDLPGAPQAVLRLRFEMMGDVPACMPDLDGIPLYLRGEEGFSVRLYEQLSAHVIAAVVLPADRPPAWHSMLAADCICPMGFTDDEALLPVSRQTFLGYRLLHEYFSFQQRYLFVGLNGLRAALRDRKDRAFDLFLLLDKYDAAVERSVGVSHFALHCTPAINLFNRSSDRIALSNDKFEYPIVVDRTRPIDFEVYAVEGVRGYRTGDTEPRHFQPFYRSLDPWASRQPGGAYFQLRRETRAQSARERQYGARSRYLGTEAYIALVDEHDAPYSDDLRQLGVDLLCTNRDLPLSMPVGVGATDFTFSAEIPADSVRCLSGPSEPRPALAADAAVWRFLNHLSLNYLSLAEGDGGARALREQLELYRHPEDEAARRQIAGLCGVAARPLTRRMPGTGPISFGRGMELTLTFDETVFEGTGAFLLGAVLHVFLSSYVSINHFVETVIRTSPGTSIVRWPARAGLCQIL
ncbi:type VI secretion system protein ImpG [Bordetella sp. H567]|uniref:type VI secretion system baseplate subunit TssF n=1 Tax=Bordetella sp. H567 TaxID=1697043 RepID=UPI00081C31FF|nr:type VI secretion system baseplate subunit TssF [Bordetella sp. H567]AOB32510.1 type VI secretion system protein ImpG [Bordetella sp. H567]